MYYSKWSFILCSLLFTLISCKEADYLYPVQERQTQYEDFHLSKSSPNLDILWVIDNSGSMDKYTEKVKLNTDRFIQEFTRSIQVKWRMGLISSTLEDRPYIGLEEKLDYSDEPEIAVQRFQDAVDRLNRSSGDDQEKLFDPVIQTLENYPGFHREGAIFGLIFLTDEPEQSERIRDPHSFVELLETHTEERGYIRIHAGVAPIDDEYGCPFETGMYPFFYNQSVYKRVVELLSGSTHIICKGDFGDHIAKIGADLAQSTQIPRFRLKQMPVRETIQVAHKGQVLPAGPPESSGYWFYDPSDNSVVIHNSHFLETEGTREVRVSYQAAN